MQLETNRLKIVSFEAELFMPLYQLFCKNETVMKSAFKGRTLTKKEFLEVLSNDFILNDTDTIGFVCVLDILVACKLFKIIVQASKQFVVFWLVLEY